LQGGMGGSLAADVKGGPRRNLVGEKEKRTILKTPHREL